MDIYNATPEVYRVLNMSSIASLNSTICWTIWFNFCNFPTVYILLTKFKHHTHIAVIYVHFLFEHKNMYFIDLNLYLNLKFKFLYLFTIIHHFKYLIFQFITVLINCNEVYRNMIEISSTLSINLKLIPKVWSSNESQIQLFWKTLCQNTSLHSLI